MRKNVGYLAGTDPLTLSHFSALGYDTIPLSNGWDNHGKYIGLLSRQDNVSLVVAYLHKLIAPKEMKTKPSDFLRACKVNQIPVLVVCPERVVSRAKKRFAGTGTKLVWTTPDTLFDKAMEILRKK
jgi:hypothetical protein